MAAGVDAAAGRQPSPVMRDAALVLALALASRLWLYGQAALINTVFGIGRGLPDLLCSWDCGWYASVATQGYHRVPVGPEVGPDVDGQANWAFFPLFPLAARAVMALGGLAFSPAAQLLNNLAFCGALWLLFVYARRWLPRDDALFVVALLAFSPFSLYFSVPYTEALYLLLMLGCLLAARQGRWLVAGLCGAALSATRNLGVFIVLPLLLLAWQQFGGRALLRLAPGTARCWLGLVLCGAGLFGYMAFLQHWVGDAQAFRRVQVAWGGEFMNPLLRLWQVLTGEPSGYERWCAIASVAGLVAAAGLAWRGLAPEALVMLIGTLIPATVRMASAPRYVLTLFPVYLAIGLWLQGRPRAQAAVWMLGASGGGILIGAWVAQTLEAL